MYYSNFPTSLALMAMPPCLPTFPQIACSVKLSPLKGSFPRKGVLELQLLCYLFSQLLHLQFFPHSINPLLASALSAFFLKLVAQFINVNCQHEPRSQDV